MKLIPTGALGLVAAAFDETVAASAGPSAALRGRWQRKADSPPAPARGDAAEQMIHSRMTGEIEQCGGEIEAEIERAKEVVANKGRALDDDRERFQKAAVAALNILSGGAAGSI
uniref:Uncharacterized protein n=1 Tax=Oryza glumipatula TaxID=40148 RepID=A0A0D9ZXF0_9ORYZ